jgi:molecular chaperone DnaK
VKIEASTSLSKDEIEKLKRDAAEHAADDEKKKALIESRNQAESLIYMSEKAIKDAGEKLPVEVKKSVEEKLEALKSVKDSEDVAALNNAIDALTTEVQKIGQAMYNQGGQNKEGDGHQNQGGEPENTINQEPPPQT